MSGLINVCAIGVLLTITSSAFVSAARAAAAICDVAACIATKCKGRKANGIQLCQSGWQFDVAGNKNKGLCK